jgi:hypothetical protein
MRKRKFGTSLAGGLAIGFLCFGLAVALVFFVIRPSIERGTHGLSAHRVGGIRVWTAGRGGEGLNAGAVATETEALLHDVAKSIDVDPEALPLPIDVFLHRDVDELIESVMNRDSDYRSVRWAALDRLPWEDPRVRIAELVLAYGWGECTSQILYAGTTLVAAYPDRDFHSFVAALPGRARHSVAELLSLESSGCFPQTFYQVYASPYAMRFGLSLGAARRHYEIPGYILSIPQQQQLYLEAASLVQYLIEEHRSIAEVRAAWDVGFSVNLLTELTGCTPAELTRAWHEAVVRCEVESSDYAQQRVRLLVESGACDAAFAITSAWSTGETTGGAWELAVVSAILTGELDVARTLLAQSAPSSDILSWANPLADGTVSTTDSVRIVSPVFASPSDADLDRIQATAEAIRDVLDLCEDDLPTPVTVVVHTDTDRMERARSTLSPYGLPSALIQVVHGDNVPLALARALPPYVLGETRSKLLKRGFALLVSRAPTELAREAARLRSEATWQSFCTLSYMGHDEEEVDVQAAALVRTILEEFGAAKLREIWHSTSTLGGGVCLDTALRTHVGITRQELEERFLAIEPTRF